MNLLRLASVLLASASVPMVFSSSLFAQHDPSGAGAAMHGAAQPTGPAKLAEVSFAPGVADKNIESFFRGLAEALKTRDGKPLLPRLAAGYTIEGLPPEWEIRPSFVKAIGMVPGPDEMVITSIKREGDIKLVAAEFHFPTRVTTKTFKFDAEDKLLGTDFIAMRRVPAHTAPSAPPPAAAPTAPKAETKK